MLKIIPRYESTIKICPVVLDHEFWVELCRNWEMLKNVNVCHSRRITNMATWNWEGATITHKIVNASGIDFWSLDTPSQDRNHLSSTSYLAVAISYILLDRFHNVSLISVHQQKIINEICSFSIVG